MKKINKEAKINVYKVRRCGYYEPRGRAAEFCDLGKALADLHAWRTNKKPTVRETLTFTPADESDQLPVFCYCTYQHSKTADFLLTTWNETETADGRFAGCHGDEVAGDAAVDESAVPDGTIPGFPTYFWFLPEHQLLATVRFDGRLNGHAGMNQYMRGFLERFARWVVAPKGAGDRLTCAITGYCDGKGDPDTDVTPTFLSTPVRHKGELSYIESNRDKIRKVMRKDSYVGGAAQSTFVRRFLVDLGLKERPQLLPDTKYRYEINMTPTEPELKAMIKRWQDEKSTDWDDVGFEFRNNDVRWLSQSLAKDEIAVDIAYKNKVVIDEQSLATALHEHRDRIVTLAGV